ncbi:short-chain dehydrogenase/reductase family 16C member 6 [Orussus abietinus]|uniref:short-chain dehydrogenase/reductase family 16C member 6 n=1 Tax=Orussus abietinus TaxID=222816 RepID=UPI000626715D|nr:short-chain dehydrogenase/reductase family 16C member 6 [Orussus abietinus]XP_012282894.1 short-chain dehydrogenase/reductase family 16C member 6 [Orussus abietinus]XP_012282895.1 short-chain dehydrogenase/reductase family 16C member 6 [Orussus abietinus]XP_012282896.1 short-chain dehydrogenase/reductase family 16C member 6 [Orussus abietinus]XP_012282897.1 short-chain dehydrogenase/reductase family 16C member 6 [Orussus abietinus]
MDFGEMLAIIYDFLLFLGMAVVYITESIILTLVPRRYREKIIDGEVALVTGGAGGIGRLIAAKLASRGATVVIWDINEQGIKDTVKEIKQAGGKCFGYHCDITDKEEVYQAAKNVKIEVGNITLLINNAGYVYGRTLLELPDKEIERTFKVNILSHYWITKSFLKDMMKENHGHIVTIASVAGLLGTYNCTDYSATKFAAIGYHESLFTELKSHGYDGIHTTLVCPYFINTGMFHGVKPRLMPMLDPEYVAEEVISGILTNAVNVTLPASVRYLLPLKCLLPAKLCWALMYRILHGPQAMMMFKGNQKAFSENNNTVTNYVNGKSY